MLGRDFSFRGVDLPWTSQEGIAAGYYTDIRWKDVQTSTEVRNKQGYHGAYVSPTLASGRLITISGEVFSENKSTRGSIRNILDGIFVLEAIPTQGGGLYPLIFTDDTGDEWTIDCQVYSMPRYSNDRGSTVIEFSVDLYAPDPFLLSTTTTTLNADYGRLYGVTLPTLLPIAFNSGINTVSTTNGGNFSANPIITITGEIINPVVHNITSGRYWKQNRTLSGSDELVINTAESTVEYNGSDDSANRATGSNFIFVNAGTNVFLLTGDDFDIDDQDKASMTIVYNKTLL